MVKFAIFSTVVPFKLFSMYYAFIIIIIVVFVCSNIIHGKIIFISKSENHLRCLMFVHIFIGIRASHHV